MGVQQICVDTEIYSQEASSIASIMFGAFHPKSQKASSETSVQHTGMLGCRGRGVMVTIISGNELYYLVHFYPTTPSESTWWHTLFSLPPSYSHNIPVQ